MHVLKQVTPLALMVAGTLGLSGEAQAAARTFIVTDFDTIRVEAPIAVAVRAGRGTTARGEGDADLLGRVDLSVAGRVLTVRLKRSPFESRRQEDGRTVRVFLTVPALRRAYLAGAGTLAVDGMAGRTADIAVSGSGALSVANISSDTVTAGLQGSGALSLSGKAAKAAIQVSGSGAVEAGKLTVLDLEVIAQGSGAVSALGTRSAKVTAIGPAAVTVDGHPACTVRHAGSGPVVCGGETY